jgi:5-methylcytosine-specific restriction endonuclease McrA
MKGGGTRPAPNGTDSQSVSQTTTQSTARTICSACGEAKRISEMAPDQSRRSGHRTQCRECRKLYDHRRYWTDSRQGLARQRCRRRQNPEYQWAAEHRRRAQRYGLDLVTDLVTLAQLRDRWGDRCVYCDGPFEVIDHRIPIAAGGHHTVDNVVPACGDCNQKKLVSDWRLILAFRTGRRNGNEDAPDRSQRAAR